VTSGAFRGDVNPLSLCAWLMATRARSMVAQVRCRAARRLSVSFLVQASVGTEAAGGMDPSAGAKTTNSATSGLVCNQ
jgi:hypothetical protein